MFSVGQHVRTIFDYRPPSDSRPNSKLQHYIKSYNQVQQEHEKAQIENYQILSHSASPISLGDGRFFRSKTPVETMTSIPLQEHRLLSPSQLKQHQSKFTNLLYRNKPANTRRQEELDRCKNYVTCIGVIQSINYAKQTAKVSIWKSDDKRYDPSNSSGTKIVKEFFLKNLFPMSREEFKQIIFLSKVDSEVDKLAKNGEKLKPDDLGTVTIHFQKEATSSVDATLKQMRADVFKDLQAKMLTASKQFLQSMNTEFHRLKFYFNPLPDYSKCIECSVKHINSHGKFDIVTKDGTFAACLFGIHFPLLTLDDGEEREKLELLHQTALHTLQELSMQHLFCFVISIVNEERISIDLFADKQLVQQILVAKGLALVELLQTVDQPCFKKLALAQLKAHDENVGLWKELSKNTSQGLISNLKDVLDVILDEEDDL